MLNTAVYWDFGNLDKYKKNKIMSSALDGKFLAQPFLELSDKTNKVRRNLNITALIAFALTVLNVKLDSINLSVVKINGVTDTKLFSVLLCVLLYHIIYFTWCTYDEYWKWRLQLIKEDTDDYTKRHTSDYSLSPSQLAVDSNLYCNKHTLNSIYSSMKDAVVYAANEKKLDPDELKDRFESAWCSSMQPVIEQDLARMKRYEDSFKNYHWQEIIKFSLLEFGLPMVLAFYGVYELVVKLIILWIPN
ncbi:hypothetical protein [Photobacterium toruni]|uniref:Uncharacterized protein n=1 Tax=Photobacterium toruni TaxID=1935446 RepID=A0A1T4UXI4_9GAMM|nr:hypothetical protein [Photobacterium toruni]SKA57355.1 hypothetical protein CZ814_03856 [Photobacterium toruni]